MNFIVGKILQSYKQPVNLLLPFDMLSSYRRFIIMKYQFDFVKSCFYASDTPHDTEKSCIFCIALVFWPGFCVS